MTSGIFLACGNPYSVLMWPPGRCLAGAEDGPKTQAQTYRHPELNFPQAELVPCLPIGWQEGKLHAPCEVLQGLLAEGHLN